MPIECQDYNQVCVLSVKGDLAGEEVAAARAAVEEAIDKRQIIDVVIDLQKSGFIDSEGLEAILWMKQRCEELFGQVKLARLDEHCRKILEITRLDHRLECHADLESALKTMR